MCNALAGLGIGLLGTISNSYAAYQQQKAYANYTALTSQAALNNYISQSKQLNLRYAQEQEASSQEAQQVQIENMKAKATAQASAASSGVEGLSIDMLFAGYDRATAVSNYVHGRNLEMLGYEYENQLDTYRIQALSTIYSIPSYSGASSSSILLSGLGGLLSTYSSSTMRSNIVNNYSYSYGTSQYALFDSAYTTGGYS